MTLAVLIKSITKLHRERKPLNITAVKRNYPELIEAAFSFRPFLGWKQALEKAGLNYAKIIIELDDAVDCLICGQQMKPLPRHLQWAHELTPRECTMMHPNAPLVSERKRSKVTQLDRSTEPHWEPGLSMEYVFDRAWFWYSTQGCCNYGFGSDRDLATAQFVKRMRFLCDRVICSIGLDPASERLAHFFRVMTKSEIICQLREWKARGLSLNPVVLYQACPRLKKSIRHKFKRFSQALKAAGLPRVRRKRCFIRQCIDFFRHGRPALKPPGFLRFLRSSKKTERQKNGQSLTHTGVYEEDRPLIASAYRFLGSWPKAKELALKGSR